MTIVGGNFAKGCSAGLINAEESGTLTAVKEKVSKAEMIRRLKEVAADEAKYFPGVLGNPVTFAARWGLPLSKSYLKFKEQELRAAKRRRRAAAPQRNGNGASHSRRRKTVAV